MKTTLYVMNESERAERVRLKLLHQNVRAAMHEAAAKSGGQAHRYALLAWAFTRGLAYRRIERDHHKQTLPNGRVFEHNLPDPSGIARALAPFFPDIAAAIVGKGWSAYLANGPVKERLKAWIADPSGAIPAPAPRHKKPYVRPEPVPAGVAA